MSEGVWFQDLSRTDEIQHENVDTLSEIKYILSELQDLLGEKNKAYGDSALNPIRLFSKADAVDALCVRIDDKLSRIKNRGITPDTEDSVTDLLGYLVLLKIALKKERGQ
tara:strand:+ start:1846 stop:2175 length:330 start_codon:yes stop_codon:yes gene_type:complete